MDSKISRNRRRYENNLKILKQYLDDKNNKKLEQECIKAFEYMIYLPASKYIHYNNYEDLIQDARLSLLLALRNFDQNKCDPKHFPNFAKYYIKTKIARQSIKNQNIKIPYRSQKREDERLWFVYNNIDLFCDFKSNEIQPDKKIDCKRVEKAFNKLPEKEKETIDRVSMGLINISKPKKNRALAMLKINFKKD